MFGKYYAIITLGIFLMSYTASSTANRQTQQETDNDARVESVIDITGTPILRIGLMTGYKRIDFHLSGVYNIEDLQGRVVLSNMESDLRWRSKIENSDSAESTYYVLLKTFGNYKSAKSEADSLVAQGYPAKVLEIGSIIRIDDNIVNDSRKFRLIVGEYATEKECSLYVDKFYEVYNPRAIKRITKTASGKIEFYDAEFEYSGTLDDGFRLIPQSENTSVVLHKIQIGKGFHWEDTEDRAYPGVIEIRIDSEGKLQAINEVPIDQYLKGVVPAEMPASYPFEALKAQAIAARSEVMSKLGSKHLNDPFDFCAAVHCQVYFGLTRTAGKSDEAVKETMGDVITFDGDICEAVYSSVCGGHTENKENVWNSPAESYLQGIYDIQGGNSIPLKLDNEKDLKDWIDSDHEVFCNVRHHDTPPALQGAVKYFRWEESYTRMELESIVRNKTGVDVGTIFGIEPLKRGVSGRLMEIEILGSRRNLKIKNELNIRRSLSKTHLKSSAFYVELVLDPDGIPHEFVLRGAGWGHGVGMCQVGAGVMAHLGYNYMLILEHYYTGTKIRQVYEVDDRADIREDIKQTADMLED